MIMRRQHAVLVIACVTLAGCGAPPVKRIEKTFATDGIDLVVFRAAEIESARITSTLSPGEIWISSIPSGDVVGYHPSDPNWRKTPASKWAFDFESKRYGSTLVVSTSGEIGHIHHHYVLRDLRIHVPTGIEVVRQKLMLNGAGHPDLSKPQLGANDSNLD